MKFFDILNKLNLPTQNFIDFEVRGIATDSRKIKNGYIFFALKGEKLNGENFIPQALKSGAQAIIKEDSFPNKNLNEILYNFCEVFYNNISQKYIAVTGTNGKTSTVNFIAQLLNLLGEKSASIGTLGVLINGDFEKNICDTGMTSPDVITLYENLQKLSEQNVEYVAIEASSHGLVQNRFGKLKFDICCFTNFTQDHLDYHGNMEKYFAAKALLFSDFAKQNSCSILNSDISEFEKLKNISEKNNLKIFDYGSSASDLKIINFKTKTEGLKINFEFNKNIYELQTELFGAFQVENLACAILAVYNFGFDFEEIISVATQLKPVKGRMEVYYIASKKASAVVDYAHTPDALEKAILAARQHCKNKLITIFGCGGDRDKTKRPIMGKIANDLSDIIIVTDDNPRTEDAKIIRSEILKTAINAKEIGDRTEAINYGISILSEGDILLVAGKGHEDYQIIGDKKIHHSDSETIINYLNLNVETLP